MSHKYHVHCHCGGQVPVELFQAGSVVNCPKCQGAVNVPSITDLKQMAGDKYPWLSAWQKIDKTLAAREVPFDGTCQKCQEKPADLYVPIAFRALQERTEAGQSHIPIPGHVVSFQHFEEFWQRTTFPLLLCFHCHERFQRARRASFWKRILVTSLFICICAGLAFWGLGKINVDAIRTDNASTGRMITAIKIITGLAIGVIVICNQLGKKPSRARRGNRAVISWLRGVPLVQDLVDGEDECRISVGRSAAWPLKP